MFNPKVKKIKTSTHTMPENKQLLASLLGFRPRRKSLNELSKNSQNFSRNFYYTDQDKLENIECLIDNVYKKDPNTFYGIVNFAAMVIGMRLGPTVALSRTIDKADIHIHSKLIKKIFTRPDFIANCVCYYNIVTNKLDLQRERWKVGWAKKLFPIWCYDTLRETFMSYGEHTLKNRKMKNKWIKLVNLIHGFQPKPINDTMAILYKNIIKNTGGAALKVEIDKTGKVVKGESLRAVLSDNNVSSSAVSEFVSENIDKIAIKELITNLTKVDEKDADKLEKRLTSLFTSGNNRLIDPMELIMVPDGYDSPWPKVHPAIINIIDNVLEKYCLFKFEDWVNPVFVFDASGSMFSDNLIKSVKYLALMKNALKNARFYVFDWQDNCNDETDYINKFINYGPTKFVKEFMEYAKTDLIKKYGSGTNCIMGLTKAVTDSRNKGFDTNTVIMITDEHHNSGPSVDDYTKLIKELDIDGRTILINTNPPLSGDSIFDAREEVFRLNDTNGKMLKVASDILYNWDEFVNKLYDLI